MTQKKKGADQQFISCGLVSFCLFFFRSNLLKADLELLTIYVVILSGMTALFPPITLAVLG